MANLYIGVKGRVLAIDRATGGMVWQSYLKGGDFVNVTLDRGELYAATKGELFRLNPATGEILWKNSLEGLGWGLISFAQALDGNWGVIEEKRRLDAETSAAASR